MTTERTCTQCGTSSPGEYRFCGRCGTRLDEQAPPSPQKTAFFSATPPVRGKLLLIKGEVAEAVYTLTGEDQVIGRQSGAFIFAEDRLLSPKHATFGWEGPSLFVEDLDSANGVFVRIKEPTPLQAGSSFLVGEQLLEVNGGVPEMSPQVEPDGTCFYGSPTRASKLALLQRLRGGEIGMVLQSRGEALTVGREGNDINFPDDPFISGRHARLAADTPGFVLTDLGSKNGTFVRISSRTPLANGDVVFIGQQLLRVELSSPT